MSKELLVYWGKPQGVIMRTRGHDLFKF